MAIIIGLVMIVAGPFLIIKTEWFINNFGRIGWFEEKLGTEGGSRLGYKLLGLLLIFLGIVAATGSSDAFMGWLLGPLIRK